MLPKTALYPVYQSDSSALFPPVHLLSSCMGKERTAGVSMLEYTRRFFLLQNSIEPSVIAGLLLSLRSCLVAHAAKLPVFLLQPPCFFWLCYKNTRFAMQSMSNAGKNSEASRQICKFLSEEDGPDDSR